MTKQPVWKFIDNLGDVSPVEYGGYFIFIDETGVYPPEAEYWDAEDNRLYRFSLDQLHDLDGHLIPLSIAEKNQEDLPYPKDEYNEWFDDDIDNIAETLDITPAELREMFCSDDVLKRAWAYREVGMYWGFENLDSYPLRLTTAQAEERFAKFLDEREEDE